MKFDYVWDIICEKIHSLGEITKIVEFGMYDDDDDENDRNFSKMFFLLCESSG